MEEKESGWSELPFCLLEGISDRLISNGDYIRFGTVCSSWRYVFLDNVERSRPPQLPLLMIPLSHVDKDGFPNGYCDVTEEEEEEEEEEGGDGDDEDDDEEGDGDDEDDDEEEEEEKIWKKRSVCRYRRSLYSMTDQMVYTFSVPVPCNVYCIGSSHGWLTTVAMDDDSYPIRLFNPFLPININEIKLPSLRTMPVDEIFNIHHYAYANKIVVSSTLTAAATSTTPSDHYLVMAIDGRCRGLVVWRPGEETWIPVEVQDGVRGFYDCIHYKGRFYAVNWKGQVVVMDDNNPKAVFHAPPIPDTLKYGPRRYIVEASGQLFQVERDIDDTSSNRFFTYGFHVFKLLDYEKTELVEDKEMKRTWREVDTLHGHAFFIGDSTSMSIVASGFPGCKPNCIYFTDDYISSFIFNPWKPKDIGVYDVVDKSFDKNFHGRGRLQWPNPIWIETTICRASRS